MILNIIVRKVLGFLLQIQVRLDVVLSNILLLLIQKVVRLKLFCFQIFRVLTNKGSRILHCCLQRFIVVTTKFGHNQIFVCNVLGFLAQSLFTFSNLVGSFLRYLIKHVVKLTFFFTKFWAFCLKNLDRFEIVLFNLLGFLLQTSIRFNIAVCKVGDCY